MRAFLLSVGAAALLSTGAAYAADYTVRYEGAPPELRGKLERLTDLSLRRRPHPTIASLRSAAEADRDVIRRALVATGYFNPAVDFRVEAADGADTQATVKFNIEPGAKFRIERHVIVYKDDAATDRPATFDAAGINLSDAADGATLEENQKRLLDHLLNKGYPRAKIVSRRAVARLAEGVADAVYTFESGPLAILDGVEAVGVKKTRPGFLAGMKTWEDGAVFNREDLVEYRDDLAETGLFTSIEVDAGAIGPDGRAPVRVTVEERKQRTIGAGVSFSTTEGPGGRLFLEYRNLSGRGERARAEIEANEVQQAFDVEVDKPLPRLPGSIFANFAFTNETTDAFDARSLEIGAGFAKRWLDDRLQTRAGLALETSSVESRLRVSPGVADERTYLVSAPLSVTWDTEDDPLLLTSGARATLFAIPYTGTDQFTRLELVGRSRRQFGAQDRFTLAGRFRIAATAGSALRSLPVNKRIFSGGGASVRGYDFQSVGPLDADGRPIGGRSAVEAAVEARAKIFGPIQLAAFVDAGAVFAESFPDFTGDYLTGAGGGVRYLSEIGPIRLDVATPLERRPTDRGFQFYISLGQPF